ncbi:Glycosylated lysosomal membrane protein B [Clonorchis sinensis]|uniref:Glycosylated lysosomal membrane protein B n=1 Tax=Clonorchis sinensis TaxID=79923 RepID=A0A8T1N3G9_CLOSI|nr:Glycosylated lysosomal membrane protein B [Clonorchis sinensis]
MLSQLISLVLILYRCGLTLSWDISAQLNPNCNLSQCDLFNIVYVRASNSTSSVHCLFAASKRISPSALIIHSSVQSAYLHVNWSLLNSELSDPTEAIIVDGITQSYAVTLLDFVEYNDKTDTADLSQAQSNATDTTYRRFSQLRWNLTSDKLTSNSPPYMLNGDEILEFTYSGNNTDTVFSSGGRVDMKFMVSNSEQHNPTKPRIKFIPGLSLQFEISLVSLKTNLSNGRFGLRLGLVSQDPVTEQDDFLYSSTSSINDEVTPGIFETVNLLLNERVNTVNSSLDPAHTSSWPAGFVQSRPVCYISDDNREVKTSRNALLAKSRDSVPKLDERKSILNLTLPYVFYGSRALPSVHTDGPLPVDNDTVGLRIQNVSLGTPGDGYYVASEFVVWTASFGLGEPPVDPLSPLLIGLLALSTVVIIGSLLFGTLIILVLRHRTRPGRFELLSESESVEPVST